MAPRDSVSSLSSLTGMAPEGDADKYFGMPGGYQNHALLLEEQQIKAHNSAMDYLKSAFDNTNTVISPTQGIAAALLAAIPTLGGAFAGRAAGNIKIPEGVYGVKGLQPQGMGAGGSLGAEQGATLSQKYIGSLDKSKEQNPILEKMASVEANEASRVGSALDQTINSGLSQAEQAKRQEDSQAFAAEQQSRSQSFQAGEFDRRQEAEIEKERTLAKEGLGRYSAADKERAFREALAMNPAAQEALNMRQRGEIPPPEKDIELQSIPGGVDAGSRALKAATYSKSVGASITGDKALNIGEKTREKIGAADNALAAQQRIRQLYQTAIEQVGPGFAQSFARQGVAALPANVQNEFMSSLDAMAMELNKAVDPTPSDAGKNAQLKKLLGSIEMGHFTEQLDFSVTNARRAALAELKPSAMSGNVKAKQMYDEYSKNWGISDGFGGSQPDVANNNSDLPKRSDYSNPQDYLNALRSYKPNG